MSRSLIDERNDYGIILLCVDSALSEVRIAQRRAERAVPIPQEDKETEKPTN